MHLRDLFSVPKNQKVTEQHLFRVLTISVCSILLCMSCLVGTTWAWFSVTIENTGNVIAIGEPSVSLLVNGQPFSSGATLTAGTYTVHIAHGNQLDDLNARKILYVTMTIRSGAESRSVYTALDHEKNLTLNVTGECTLSWEVSWFAPNQAEELVEDVITVAGEHTAPPAETTEAP